jgi:uncharacterized protein YycO
LIAGNTEGPYSHAAMALWRGDVLALAESREYYGFRVVTLSSQVEANPGVIDVYRPKCEEALCIKAADWMFRQAGESYGWRSLAADAEVHLPIIRTFLRLIGYGPHVENAVEPTFDDPKFCSEAVVWSYRQAWKDVVAESWDPYPGLRSQYVEPNHLGHSAAFDVLYEGLTIQYPRLAG